MTDNDGVPADGGQGAEGTPPASPPSPPAAPPSPPAPPPEPPKPFYASLKNAELRGYAETKGFKGDDPVAFAETVLDSYRNLEKLRGVPAERLLQLPENLDDAEALKPILAKLGFAAPETADEYGFVTMEGADPDFAKQAQGWMHELGVPPKMAQAIAGKWNEHAKAQTEAQTREIEEAVAVERGQLEAAWGGKHGENLETARRFARMIGASDEDIAAMETNVGYKRTMEIFLAGGQRLGEANFVPGEKKDGFAMTPEAAKVRIAELGSNAEWRTRYLNGDKAALAEMTRLQQIAHPGAVKPL